MNAFDWLPLLQRWSSEWLASGDDALTTLPDEIRASGYLGFEPATEAELVACEERLGTPLPPSYRSFLATSNGWTLTSPFIYRLWSTREVDWFRVRNQQWIDAYADAGAPEGEHLRATLEISDVGDSAILLLNPLIVDEAGEWEAWSFANWHPGAELYPSFHALMEDEYESFRRLI